MTDDARLKFFFILLAFAVAVGALILAVLFIDTNLGMK